MFHLSWSYDLISEFFFWAFAEVSSMVAAMCYAWMQENTSCKVASDTWHAVPMIDIPRHLMHKHKDAAWLFDACGIDAESLLFANEVLHRACGRQTRRLVNTNLKA